MIIYLTSTKLTEDYDKELLKKVEKILGKNKCKILGNNSSSFSPENLFKRTENEIKKQYTQMSANIRKSNAAIALITAQSAEIGKEVAEAIQGKIPTLILFSGKTLYEKLQIPKDKKNVITYKKITENNIQETIEQFINENSQNDDVFEMLLIKQKRKIGLILMG